MKQLYPKKAQNAKLNLTHENKEVSFEANTLKIQNMQKKKRATKSVQQKKNTIKILQKYCKEWAIKVIPYRAQVDNNTFSWAKFIGL